MAKGIFADVPTKRDAMKFLEYIEGTGTQYINTGYYQQSEKIRIKAEFEYVGSSGSQCAFGAQSGNGFLMTLYGQKEIIVGTNGSTYSQYTRPVGTRFLFDVTANNGTLSGTQNGQSLSSTYTGTLVKTVSLAIFHNNGGATSQICPMKVYSFQIYDNDVLVRDYVPCQAADGAIGLYDKVNSQFYGNAGTGAFTAGSVVEEIGGDTITTSQEAKMFFTDLTGIYRKIKKGFVTTADGVYHAFYSGGIDLPVFDGSYAIFGNEEQGYIEMYSSGTLTLSNGLYDVHLVGGGASGSAGDYSTDYQDYIMTWSNPGGATEGFGFSAGGGKTQKPTPLPSYQANTEMAQGSAGGSGGGAAGSYSFPNGKSGGSNGSAGASQTSAYFGGAGQGTTTYDFQDPTWTLRAGGGGGGASNKGQSYYDGGAGGAGGGGKGGHYGKYAVGHGVANTGGGGGGTKISAYAGGGGGSGYTTTVFAQQLGGDYPIVIASGGPSTSGKVANMSGAGGSGIAIVRWGY